MQNLPVDNNFYVYVLRRLDRTDPYNPNIFCPFYVGKGRNGRIKEHRMEANRLLNKPGKKSLKIKIIHYLWENKLDFKEEIIIDNLSKYQAFDEEKSLISFYGRVDIKTGVLANMDGGGPNCSYFDLSEEIRKKISDNKKGTNNPMFGRTGSRNSFFGRKHSQETKKKIGQKTSERVPWNKGIPMTEEQKLKINFAKRNPNYHPSEESNRKRSETLKIKYNTEEYKQKLSKTMKRVWAIRRGEILND